MKRLKYILYPFAIPHMTVYLFSDKYIKDLVQSDIEEMNCRCHKKRGLMYWLVFAKPYRNLFYNRIHRLPYTRILSFLLPRYRDFYINNIRIGSHAFVLNHPYGTIINARKIGSHFTCCHLTTIGNKNHGQNEEVPTIGDNVSLGANVTIIGDVHIGNNVVVGAGSVVVKDVMDNSVIAGNPAHVIKMLEE